MTTTASQPKARSWTTLTLLLGWSWVMMTLTHELGHVIGGWASGARLTSLEIRPWRLPYSLFAPDPLPLVTLWAGPIIGCAGPLVLAITVRRPAMWLMAWFCVLANASYLLLGTFSGDPELDSQKIIGAGTSRLIVLLFVAMTGPVSYVAFRDGCVKLMAEQEHALTPQACRVSALALIAFTIIQSIVGGLIR